MPGYIGFIPCRAGSERVKNKNTRPFAGFSGGLLELKLKQMTRVSRLEEIVVSSNDPAALDIADAFARRHDGRVTPLERPEEFGTGATSMEAFIRDYIAHLRDDGVLFWTHVTHPFVRSDLYDAALDAYESAVEAGYDCLVSATKLQKFLWRDGRPFNYDNSREKWPRSQDLTPVHEINHAIYAIPFPLMRRTGDRIGERPFFFEMNEADAMDIDWEDQFDLVEEIARARLARDRSLL